MSNEIREIFETEVQEILSNLESDIVRLEETDDDSRKTELVNRIFRFVHTIKGSSGIAGFPEISQFTHKLENLLDLVRKERLQVTAGLTDIVLTSIDWVKSSVFGGDDEERLGAMLEALEAGISALLEPGDSPVQKKERPVDDELDREIGYRYFRIRARFRSDIFENGIDPLMVMEDLVALGSVLKKKIYLFSLPSIEKMDPEKCYSGWELYLKTKKPRKELDDVFLFVRDGNDIEIENITHEYVKEVDDSLSAENKKIGEILVEKGIITREEFLAIIDEHEASGRKIGEVVINRGFATEKEVTFALTEQEKLKKKVETNTIRINANRLDNLMNLLGEIVIGQSSIYRIAEDLDEEKEFILKNALHGLDRTTREFQEQLMAIRMVPIGPTFEQFRRFVRDTAQTLGKKISLEMKGAETELDKTVIEKIGDPLKHMIRNAIDHGIELPDERAAAGKKPEGTITLNAFHQEGSVYIEVIDDGRGLDPNRIRVKAESLGLVRKGEEISDRDLYSFLFMPGFSTAENVGDLSGRGVGMDVVKTNIESLRGMTEIESVFGRGSTFRIKLPLTLAIIEGMLIQVSNSVYIVPLLSIVESIQPKREEVKTIEGKGEVILVRGEYITLVRLYELFGLEPVRDEPWESLVVIVESTGKRIGLMVDDLLGQQQIVIKNLKSAITATRSVSGAAILGDGRVALILDIHGLAGELDRKQVKTV